MAEVLRLLGLCLGALHFVFDTMPTTARILNRHRERSSHAEGIKVRLGSCQARFGCWEGHSHMSSLQERHGISIDTFRDLQSIKDEVFDAINDCPASDAHKKAWRKTKSRLRRNTFSSPLRFSESLRDATWYDLWSEDDLDWWMNRLEKIIAAVDMIFEEDSDQRAAERYYNSTVTQGKNLRELGTFASRFFDLGNELHRSCTTESSTFGWAIGLKPPQPDCDISRWFVPIPIDVELRFWVKRELDVCEQFRMHVSYREHDHTEAIKETLAQISGAKDEAIAVQDVTFKFTQCHKQNAQTEEPWSIGSLLEAGVAFFREDTWLFERASLGYAISQWSLLFWDTPWLEKLCCHGILLDISARSDEYAHHVYEHRSHDNCQPGSEDHKIRNLGLAWAQLALAIPIRPAPRSDLEFEICSGKAWKTVHRDEINSEILMKTGSASLQEAIDICLRSESQILDESSQPELLLRCIETLHKPLVYLRVDEGHSLTTTSIKAWYEAESMYLKTRLESFASSGTTLPHGKGKMRAIP